MKKSQDKSASAIPEAWTRDQGSTSALVAMVATNVILILMLAA